jgi:serine protease
MSPPSSTFHRHPLSLAVALLLALLVACQDGAPPITNQPPVASFTAANTIGPAPLSVTFDASGSFDPDGSIVGLLWDFGTGTTGSGVVSSHVYTAAGGYTARLTVTDDRGATASATVEISVGTAVTTGRIAGTITAGATPAAAAASGSTGLAVPQRYVGTISGHEAEVVPGEVIVRFRGDLALQSAAVLGVDGVRVEAVRSLALPGTQLYRAPGLGRAETVALAEQLATRPDVLYAQPNYLLRTMATPNDEFYAFQWHYPAINLPAAWDITTGSSATVVAVGDTGILHLANDAAATHPDFTGKVLPGYDFVSSPQSGGDGDGRDPNPYDLGDSYHGSHVAGTIAAATHNGIGLAGVDWQAKIVPVRMLGVGGSGSLVDIIEGTLWAAGFAVPGVPTNAHPAHVINLSLGGSYACTPFEQEAFDRIAAQSARRTIVVVAAGNENQNAANASPASCRNVITVGATEFRGHRAPYSNYGSRIDVMAPGGDMSVDRNGDTYPDGVLSLGASSAGFTYAFENGTSMAAPHVAGVVSLMKALDPTIGLQDALALLKVTARPLSAAACERAAASDCGAGLIDAAAALAALQQNEVPNPGGGLLAISPNPLDFGADQPALDLTLANGGDAAVSWAFDGYDPSPDDPGEMADGTVTASALFGTIPARSSAIVTLSLDRSRVTADGAYQFTLYVLVDDVERTVTVRFRAGAAPSANPQGPTIVAAFLIDEAEDFVLSGFQEASVFFTAYGFDVRPGSNVVIAWIDENEDGEIDAGDYIGIYPSDVAVVAGQALAGIDFVVERVVDLGVWQGAVGLPAGERWPRAMASLRPTP